MGTGSAVAVKGSTPSEAPGDAMRVGSEWQRWVAENLLDGASTEELVDALVEEGVPQAHAAALLQEMRASPLMAAARTFATRTKRAELVLRLERDRLSDLTIERRRGVDGETFHRSIRPAGRPVLLEGLLDDTPALKNWSFEWFANKYRGESIRYIDYSGGAKKIGETTVENFVDLIEGENATNYYSVARMYMLRNPVFASMFDDADLPPGFVVDDINRQSTQMWIGPAGTQTPLHFDTSDILFSQIVGEKRVQLVPPCEMNVFDFHERHTVPEARFDALVESGALVLETVVKAGEVLFLPVGWMHRVEALSASITLSINGFRNNAKPWYAPGEV